MKKILVIVGIICGLAITGSVSAYFLYIIPTNKESDLELKEKCAKYIPIAKDRIKKMDEGFELGATRNYYIGTFYSKAKKTCLTLYYRSTDFANNGNYIYTLLDHDELTGQEVDALDLPIPSPEEIDKVSSRYQLIK
jgi:hypothetical protein